MLPFEKTSPTEIETFTMSFSDRMSKGEAIVFNREDANGKVTSVTITVAEASTVQDDNPSAALNGLPQSNPELLTPAAGKTIPAGQGLMQSIKNCVAGCRYSLHYIVVTSLTRTIEEDIDLIVGGT